MYKRQPPVAYLDDVTLVRRPAAVGRAFKQLVGNGPDSLRSVGVKVRPDKSGVFGGKGLPRNQQPVAALAATLGVQHRRDGFTIVGVAIGNDGYVQSELDNRARKVRALVRKCINLLLSKQTQFLLLRASLSVRMVPLQRVVEWRHLAASTTRVQQAVLWAAAQIFRLPAGQVLGGLTPSLATLRSSWNSSCPFGTLASVSDRPVRSEPARRSCPVQHQLSW